MPQDIAEPRGREAHFLLPGMTLNETIFPAMERPWVATDFNTLLRPPSSIAGYAAYADAVWRVAARHHDAPWIVVAHSFGGMVAMQWLLDRPERAAHVRGLVLVGTSPGPLYDDVRLRLAGTATSALRVPAARLIPMWNSPTMTRLAKRVLAPGPTRRVDFQTLTQTSDLAVDRAGWRNTSITAMRGFRSAARGFDIRDRLGALDVPTVVLHGTRDSLFRTESAHRLGEALPNADVRIVHGAAHLLPLTHPAWVRDAVASLGA